MSIFNMLLRNVVRRSVFPFAMKERRKNGLFLTSFYKTFPHRTLNLSPCLKDAEPNPSQKLNLDEWKNVMKSRRQEEICEPTSKCEEDSTLTAMREFVEMRRLASRSVPKNVTEEALKTLMELPTKSSRLKYLKFLAEKEKKINARKAKQEKKKQDQEELLGTVEKRDTDELKNTLLRRFNINTMENLHSWRAANAMIFGQPLVFDMVYENCMSRAELGNAVDQMMECEGFNRKSVDPFHLHYCNLSVDGPYHKGFSKRYGEAWDKLLVTVTEQCYTNLFPRDRLIYLTPDSRKIMTTFEHDKIYIIGSLVDKTGQPRSSFAQARRLNLPTAKLPLDKYLRWTSGRKSLTLNQMLCILLTLKETGDWKKALQFVPQRCYDGFVDVDLLSRLNDAKF
ncbi:tRNA methyltransferase 10 homolog C [Alligator mississippiensis]|uniref:tRNA methyltransferase 10 homolog C n=1 Tax=Alligator mississippiensis TaxID=8496 RepID=UPI0003D0B155|nr:tRNA methyltransferase 10 homolog C [Alligator mississippiensis]